MYFQGRQGKTKQAAEEQSECTPGTECGRQTDNFFFLMTHKNNGAYPCGHLRVHEVTCSHPGFEKKKKLIHIYIHVRDTQQ